MAEKGSPAPTDGAGGAHSGGKGPVKRLILFGCAHLGSKTADLCDFEAYVKLLAEPNTYGLMLGDMFENAIPARGEGMVWDQNSTPQQQLADAVAILRPFKSKIVKACGSNHSERTWKEVGIDIDLELYERLGIPDVYVGPEGVCVFEGKKIAFAHGGGSGDNWNDAKKLYAIYPDADIVCVSHRHEMTMKWFGKRSIDAIGRQREDFALFARTGGLMKWARYARREIYSPQKRGFTVLHFLPGGIVRADCNGL